MSRVARTYRLDADLVARVEERAKVLGQSYTVFVTRALEEWLEETRPSGPPLSQGEAIEVQAELNKATAQRMAAKAALPVAVKVEAPASRPCSKCRGAKSLRGVAGPCPSCGGTGKA